MYMELTDPEIRMKLFRNPVFYATHALLRARIHTQGLPWVQCGAWSVLMTLPKAPERWYIGYTQSKFEVNLRADASELSQQI